MIESVCMATTLTHVPQADEEDYVERQGGVPTVEKKGKSTTIIHDYEGGEGMRVANAVDYGTVILNTSRGPREFKVNLLREFHGGPCEKQSLSMGGEGYPRSRS